MKKFDLKKMIAENKATFFTSLSENKKKYYKDAEADDAEHIEALKKDMKDDKKASKMTKEELKAKIKEMALTEMGNTIPTERPDGTFDISGIMKELNINIEDENEMYDPLYEEDDEYYDADEEQKRDEENIFMSYDDDGSRLDEASIDALNRMDGLVSQNYLSMMFRAASGIIRDLKNEDFEEDEIYDYLNYLITTLDDSVLTEEEEEEEVEAEEEVDVDVEDPEPAQDGGIAVTQNADAELTGAEKETQDNLEAALEAAKKLGDQKLVDQIGNSITFFTRQHVVKEDLNESTFPILKKILK